MKYVKWWHMVHAEMSRGQSLQAGDSLAMPVEPLSPTRQVRTPTPTPAPACQTPPFVTCTRLPVANGLPDSPCLPSHSAPTNHVFTRTCCDHYFGGQPVSDIICEHLLLSRSMPMPCKLQLILEGVCGCEGGAAGQQGGASIGLSAGQSG